MDSKMKRFKSSLVLKMSDLLVRVIIKINALRKARLKEINKGRGLEAIVGVMKEPIKKERGQDLETERNLMLPKLE